MPIRVICVCGRGMLLPDKYAGQHVQCPDCRAMLKMPTREEDLSLTRWFCSCGLRLKARARAAGRKIRCPRCGAVVTVPLLEEGTFSLDEPLQVEAEPQAPVQLEPEEDPRPRQEQVYEVAEEPGPAPPQPEGGEEDLLELVPLSSKEAEELPVAQEAPQADGTEADTYEISPQEPPVRPESEPVVVTPKLERARRLVRLEEDEEGIRAHELSRYFNVRSGGEAARTAVTHVLNGYLLYIPYALIGGMMANLILLLRSWTAGNLAAQVGLMAAPLLIVMFLWTGFIGCLKDAVFERHMGIERFLHHGARHFLRFAGTCVLMVPVGMGLWMAAARGVQAFVDLAPGPALKILILVGAAAVALFSLVWLMLPPVVSILEETNPLFAVGRGLLFGLRHLWGLITLTVMSLFIAGGAVGLVWLFWWLGNLFLFMVLPLWLYAVLRDLVASLIASAVMAHVIAALMVLYLSNLKEERLQKIRSRLRGPEVEVWRLYVTVAVCAMGMFGLSSARFRALGLGGFVPIQAGVSSTEEPAPASPPLEADQSPEAR